MMVMVAKGHCLHVAGSGAVANTNVATSTQAATNVVTTFV